MIRKGELRIQLVLLLERNARSSNMQLWKITGGSSLRSGLTKGRSLIITVGSRRSAREHQW